MSTSWLRGGWSFLVILTLILSAFAFSRSAAGMALARFSLAFSDLDIENFMTGIEPLAGAIALTLPFAILVGVLALATRPLAFLASVLVVLHLPGVLSQSALDWGRLLWGTPVLPDALVSPWETTALALGTATVFSGAWLLARWEKALSTFGSQGIDSADTAQYLRNSFASGASVVSGAVCVTLIALLVTFGLSARPQWVLSLTPWPVAMSGLAAVAVTCVVVYFLRFRWMEEGARPLSGSITRAPSLQARMDLPDATGQAEGFESSPPSRLRGRRHGRSMSAPTLAAVAPPPVAGGPQTAKTRAVAVTVLCTGCGENVSRWLIQCPRCGTPVGYK